MDNIFRRTPGKDAGPETVLQGRILLPKPIREKRTPGKDAGPETLLQGRIPLPKLQFEQGERPAINAYRL